MSEEVAVDDRFLDPREEADYRDASALLLDPPPSSQKVQLLLFSLVAFIVATYAQDMAKSVVQLATLLGILTVHELGHVVGMRMFGYRDVKMFFIPFFGAAASGRRRGVERWKQGVVLLLGPVPGILIGAVLAYVGGPELRTLALMAIIVNGVNLLPLSQLDGGQLFQILLFARHRHVEVVFLFVTAGLIAVAGALGSMYFILFLGLLMLMQVPHRRRILATAHLLRGQLPADPAELDDRKRRTLYRAMWDSLPAQWQTQWRGKPRQQAQVMEDILERATMVSPDTNASVALGAVWLVAMFVALVSVAETLPPASPRGLTAPRAAAIDWQIVVHDSPHFTITMPVDPIDDGGADEGQLIAVTGTDATYLVSWTTVGDAGERWLALQNDTLLKRGRVVSDKRIDEYERHSSVELAGGAVEVARLVIAGELGYMIVATAPPGSDSLRFVQSFAAN
jgi:Zn-dependent protease